MKHILMILLILCSFTVKAESESQPQPQTESAPQILQLVDYVGLDYTRAISAQGKIISPAEYEEMKEFTATIEKMLLDLPRMPAKIVLQSKAKKLFDLVHNQGKPEQVQAMAKDLSATLREELHIITAPTFVPDLKMGAVLYREHCASCHGEQGRGDGPLGAALSPSPGNFHDTARMSQLSIFALYNTISLGVEGTGMAAYQSMLPDPERWALALYVSGLSATPEQIAKGKALWQAGHNGSFTTLQAMMTITPEEAELNMGKEGLPVLSYLQHHPDAIIRTNPFTVTLSCIEKSMNTYTTGDAKLAYQQALLAYIEGFETAEAVIDVVAGEEERIALEAQLAAYRTAIEKHASVQQVRTQYEALVHVLTNMRDILPKAEFTEPTIFASAFIILLREGLESILIIGMLVMMVVKADRRNLLRGIHLGWIAALVAGVATWWASSTLIHMSGAVRELAEGVTALVAAGILLYVGIWMHTHNIAHDWRSYLKNRLNKHLQEEAWFGLSLLSFLAVYREVFETILFYEALGIQVGTQGMQPMFMGIGAAAAVLMVLVFLMVRFGLQLPLQQFFKVSAVLIFMFAIIFVGQGIHSLEEAGKVPVWNIPFFRVDMLGIYPNLFGLIIQGIILLIAFVLSFRSGK